MPVATPMEASSFTAVGKAADTEYPYREAVGALMYLATCTRPDIVFAVSYLVRICSSLTTLDVTGVNRVFRYFRGTISTGIKLGGGHNTIVAYADADYALDSKARRPVSGSVLFLGDGPVAWSSRRQACVTLSTVEAEYLSMSGAVREVVLLRSLLRELGHRASPPLFTITSMERYQWPRGRDRAAVPNTLVHYIREPVAAGEIKLILCSSEKMIADVLTNAPSATIFKQLSAVLICEGHGREEVSA